MEERPPQDPSEKKQPVPPPIPTSAPKVPTEPSGDKDPAASANPAPVADHHPGHAATKENAAKLAGAAAQSAQKAAKVASAQAKVWWQKALPFLQKAAANGKAWWIRSGQPKCRNLYHRYKPRTAAQKAMVAVAALLLLWGGYKAFLESTPAEFVVAEDSDVKPYESFIVDPENLDENTNLRRATRHREFSILKPFRVVTAFNNLVPEKTYTVTMSVEDDDGNEVLSENQTKPFDFSPSTPKYTLYADVTADYKIHEPGTWTLTVDLQKVGEVEHEFSIAPPTPTEKENLQNYEKAREVAYSALANYWIGINHRDAIMFLTSLEPGTQKIAAKEKTRSLYSGSNEKKEKTMEEARRLLNDATFFQISGVEQRFYEDVISEADRLNGITYRGKAAFNFTVFRVYFPDRGWTDWVDVDRPGSELEDMFTTMMAEMLSMYAGFNQFATGESASFGNPPLAHGLRFEVYERDNNWFAVSDLGDLFVNGAHKGEDKKPGSFEVYRAALLPDKRMFQPKEESARVVVQTGKNPRDIAKELGDSVRASPQAVENQVAETMRLLRGREL